MRGVERQARLPERETVAAQAAEHPTPGADRLVDYIETDITCGAAEFDVIIDIAGNRELRALRRMLAPRGRLVIVGIRGKAVVVP